MDTVLDKVLLKHPHKPNDPPVEVENTGEALTPYMASGYQQYRPPADLPTFPIVNSGGGPILNPPLPLSTLVGDKE